MVGVYILNVSYYVKKVERNITEMLVVETTMRIEVVEVVGAYRPQKICVSWKTLQFKRSADNGKR